MKDKAKFVLSRSAVKGQLAKMEETADMVSYSLKTNYEVGKVLEEESSCLFSVHSIEALRLLQDKGRAIFFAQAWDREELEELFEEKVNSFVVDNEADLNTLLAFLDGREDKITLFLRMRLKENTIHTGKHFVFGLRADRVNALIPELKKNKSIASLGIHFHRKTQNVSEWGLKDELEASIDEKSFEMIDIANIGGGLPSIYKNYSEAVMQSIFGKIKELRAYLNEKGVRMMIEPGRFIAAPSVKLVAKIKNIYSNNIIINCSVYNSAMDTFIAHIRLLVEGELEKGTYYTIKGSTPDSMDIFRYKVYLDNPQVGNRITFLNAGAYNFATDFCKLPKIETEIVD